MLFPHRCFVATLLICSFLFRESDGALTRSGLPNGQTLVPKPLDYFLLYPLPRQHRRGKPRSSRKPSPAPRNRPGRVSLSTQHPFFTLRNTICPGTSFTPLSVVNGTKEIAVLRSVSSAQLSKMMDRASASHEVILALFHGGADCTWSRQIWPVWATFARRMRAVCVVAIDARKDSMLNYNLMVLGFPTIIRLRGDRASDSFSGNRTVNRLVAWASRVGGGAPMDDVVREDYGGVLKGVELDGEILQLKDGSKVERLQLREGEVKKQEMNWALIGAHLVTFGNAVYAIWWLWLKWLVRKPGENSVDEGRPHQD